MQQKAVKSVLNKLKKRDDWFLVDYTINPYEGCSCNCLYCYVRGSKYGEDMEDGLVLKSNAPEILEKQLAARAKKSQYGIVAVGSATDAYMKQEENYKATRRLLELLLKYRFPVFISTKSTLINRDVDLLHEIDKAAILPDDLKVKHARGVILAVSLSTLDENISNFLEPGAATPSKRLELVKELKQQGFLTGVNAMPLLPHISDTDAELENIIKAAAAFNANYILTSSLTLFGSLPADSKTLFFRFLEKYNTNLITKYEALYGSNFQPPFSYQQTLKKRTLFYCSKYNIRNSILT